MISIEERKTSTSGSTAGWECGYIVMATDSDAEENDEFSLAELVVAGVPATLSDSDGGVLILSDVRLVEFHDTPSGLIGIYTAVYGPPEEGSRVGAEATTPLASAVYEFSYQAPSEHIYLALRTRSFGTNPPFFDNRIKCRYDGPDLVHDGLDLPAGNTTNVWRLNVPRGFASTSYEMMVENMVGKVNATAFKGRPPGTMRFVQCQSSLTRGASLSMTWGFQYSPNIGIMTVTYDAPFGSVTYDSGLPAKKIDDISGVSKPGHWVAWNLDQKKLDLTAGKMVLEARAIYVQEVFEVADFNDLGF